MFYILVPIFAVFKFADLGMSIAKLVLIYLSNMETLDDATLDTWVPGGWYLWDDNQRQMLVYELYSIAGKIVLWFVGFVLYFCVYALPGMSSWRLG